MSSTHPTAITVGAAISIRTSYYSLLTRCAHPIILQATCSQADCFPPLLVHHQDTTFGMQINPSGVSLATYRGGIALVGPALETAATHFGVDGVPATPRHITILDPTEYKAVGKPGVSDIQLSLDRIYCLGQVTKKNVEWLVIVFNHADVWRKTMGLKKKEYHITLSDENNHDISKGVQSLLATMTRDELVAIGPQLDESGMDHMIVGCWGDVTLQLDLSEQFVVSYPDSYKGYLRLASLHHDPKISALALVRAAAIDPSLAPLVTSQLQKLRAQTSWGPLATATELEQIPASLRPLLLQPWPASLAVNTLWTAPTASRDRCLHLGHRPLPRFFSWIYPGRIAGMSTLRNKEDVGILQNMGFTHVLSLTEESPLDESWFTFKLQRLFIPVPNYHPPTIAEMDYIYNKIKEGGVWLIHCGGGVGRAGTVLACLMAMMGREGIEEDTPKLDAKTAISLLRHSRPGSLETEHQETFVASWVSHRWKSAYSDTELDEPCTVLQQVGTKQIPDNAVIFLIGRPGSGKSWLSSAISKRRTQGSTLVISQDENRSRSACERELSCAGNSSGQTMVIFDRCNPQKADRKEWLKLVDRPCVAVYFDYSKELCRKRIDQRVAHPTIRAGRGTGALKQFDKQMEHPVLEDGFATIFTITSFSAARGAVIAIAGNPHLLKFPRTPHLLDLGATTSDDIVLDKFESLTGNLTIEEKIDGANMGISLDWDGVIRCQNRSHWVSSADHPQFKPLDLWIATHSDEIYKMLHQDPQFPERFILYGEWMVAKHSINYTHLPAHFIAFDLFDRLTDTFLSRQALSDVLKGTSIPQVPLIMETNIITRADTLQLLQKQSEFSESRIEGVYVRTENEERSKTIGRGKVVRGDFIAGDQHWGKGALTLNNLKKQHDW
ncbi:hypothetical protein IAT38_006109 [Cryptococcus sp. DSM 104549]